MNDTKLTISEMRDALRTAERLFDTAVLPNETLVQVSQGGAFASVTSYGGSGEYRALSDSLGWSLNVGDGVVSWSKEGYPTTTWKVGALAVQLRGWFKGVQREVGTAPVYDWTFPAEAGAEVPA